MARALDFQREGLTKLVGVMVDETKKIGTFTIEGSRRLDETAAIMAQRIVETTQLFTRESEKLRTSTELTTSGLEQAMQTIRSAGDSSFDAAGRLGSVLISLRETAATASQQIEGTVERLGKLAQQMPASAQTHQLRTALDQQAEAARDLSARVNNAFDRVRQAEPEKPQPKAQPHQPAPNFNVPPPQANLAPPPRNQVPPAGERPQPAYHQDAPAEQQRGWFGLTKRFAKPIDNAGDQPEDRNAWDMKSLLAAAESEATKPAIPHQPAPQRPQPQPQPTRVVELRADQVVPESTVKRAPHPATPPQPAHGKNGHGEQTATSSRHMIETLQAMAIDLDRFLEDDPPLDLLRRYRNGERNVFARRLVQILGREQAEAIGRKYAEDGEFRETVDRYILQFEALMEQTARSDRENVLVETYLTSQTGKVYVALASAIGRLS
jgi:PAS domain-containing protein